ncbi:hypothetical protein EYF80_056629 [Liparis tanakae]|uniref:Uncharacterized protein n=1 Tax=Liparis tanakae TaxID=230148 RepID=A0A4Z2EWN1_9TELE|nr:hypothetical protein EYF80_056629 [Liparis tanakae]
MYSRIYLEIRIYVKRVTGGRRCSGIRWDVVHIEATLPELAQQCQTTRLIWYQVLKKLVVPLPAGQLHLGERHLALFRGACLHARPRQHATCQKVQFENPASVLCFLVGGGPTTVTGNVAKKSQKSLAKGWTASTSCFLFSAAVDVVG